MPTDRGPLPDVNGWEAQTLQLIAFPVEKSPSPPPLRWEALTGTPPTNTQAKPYYRQEMGEHQGVNLTVATDPARVVWLASPIINLEEAAMRMPTLRPYPEVADRFVDLMCRWLPQCPAISRLGFSAKLVRLVEGDDDATLRVLGTYLRKVQLDPGSGDFLYRINRRKRSATPSLTDVPINRLSTWAVVKFQIQVETGILDAVSGAISPTRSDVSHEGHACSLEVDINTAPEHKTTLPTERLPDLFRELAGFGKEIAEKGDI